MADYNLLGLSSRSFEQLVQAIAIKRISSTIRIFGDGRDGGREATFEGSVPYPSPDDRWNGYGIIQAKFLQRPQGSGKDGDWALQQLRAELKKFANPKKPRRKPEYYIFATNVVLTPVEGQGSQDKAYDLFNEFKDEVPLKGYDIWDYDKLRAFLDDYEDIRRSYAAFITHGDVLAQVIEWLQPSQPDFKQILYSFLQRELLTDQYANLEQAGRATEEKVPIARVFIDLPTFGQPLIDPPKEEGESNELPPGFVASVLSISPERLNDQYLDAQTSFDDSSDRISFQERGRFVLVGGPGQGKSTVGQFICQLFRTAILKDRANWRHTPDVEQILQLIAIQCKSEGIELPTARRFPFRIVLNEFAKELASSSGRITSVLTFIVERIKKKTDRDLTPDDLRKWLSTYPWLLILDGLDEVPASSNRAEVLEAIQDFRIEVRECNADILIIATSRPQGYNQDFAPHVYQHQWLAPLSPARALHYASRLAEVRYGNDNDRKEKVLTLLRRASDSETTARLMRSPLQVTIMTTLIGMRGQPPQERWSLFKEYYKVIYQREVEREIPTSEILRDYKSDIDRIHHRIGLILQVKSERTGETDTHLSVTDFANAVAHRLTEEGHEGQELERLVRQITEAATDRLVFLVGLRDDEVGFEIRSLLEFMAAEALMGDREDIVRRRLRQIAPIANWRNVFLFAAGKCFAERQELRDTIHTICAELNDAENDELSRAVMEGSRVALDLLEDGLARTQPKYARLLARAAFRILNLPPDYSAVRLADLYESSLESVYREELEQHLSYVETSRHLAAWTCLIPLIEADIPWAKEIGDKHWPVTDSEQFDLLKVARTARGGAWVLSKVRNILLRLQPTDFVERVDDEETSLVEHYNLAESTWLNAIKIITSNQLAMSDAYEVPLNLLGGTDRGFSVLIHGASTPQIEWTEQFQGLPDFSPAWGPVIAAGRFLAHPSKHALAQELNTIATTLKDEVALDFGQIKGNYSRLPWPLAACIDIAQNSEDLFELANKVAAGKLGDIQDWEAAEERWREHGITIEDIEYMTDEHQPFDDSVAHRGFPFAAISLWSLSSRDRDILFNRLLEIHKRLEPSRMSTIIAGWALFVMRSKTRPIAQPETVPSYTDFAAVIDDLLDAKQSISPVVLNAFAWESPLDTEWTELLDRIGRQPYFYDSSGAHNDLLSVLSAEFESNQTYEGLLRLLAFFALGGSIPRISDGLLKPERFSGGMFKEAAVLIRLAQGDLSLSEPESLADQIAELTSEGLDTAASVLKLLENEFLPHSKYERFLLNLRKRLPSSEWQILNRLRHILVTLLTTRTSRLEDVQVWAKLGLPTELHSLATVRTSSALDEDIDF
jgi:hypothetical protein